ncbi:protein-domain-containing protein [Powellomyces hirtus]|nr:protein-domain-containing protein [Powellomyces hirtus]
MPRHVLFDLNEQVDRQDPRDKRPTEFNSKELAADLNYILELGRDQSESGFLRVLSEQAETNPSRVFGGLLCAILTDPKSQFYTRLLEITVNDNYDCVVAKLRELIDDADLLSYRPFRCLRPYCRAKVVELLERLADSNIEKVQPLLVILTRQIRSGDLSTENTSLARGIVGILRKHRSAFKTGAEIVPATVYSFLRLIADHEDELRLREQELDYVCYMLRNRFRECVRIGRDLYRVLMCSSELPPIKDILRDMHKEPRKLDPTFDVSKLLATPSEPWIISQRITREMDVKMRFILDKTETNLKKHPIENYRILHLIHDGNESAFVDVIRFICTAVHPPNEILRSNTAQRWEVIMKLLSSIESLSVSQDAKLALLFDWICWNPDRDNIMCIEPAMLLIEKGGVQEEMTEYFDFIIKSLMPEMKSHLTRNVNKAMHSLVKFGVTRNVLPMEAIKNEEKRKSLPEAVGEILSDMDFDTSGEVPMAELSSKCATMCESLCLRRSQLFGNGDLQEVLAFSLENWDEITMMFLWKLIVAEKGGDPSTVEKILMIVNSMGASSKSKLIATAPRDGTWC